MAPLGAAPGIILGVGVGGAAAAALEPTIEVPRQASWEANPHRILDPNILARLVAQGGVSLDDARADAKRDGYDADKMDALVYLAKTTPPVTEALLLWRRGLLSDELWAHVLVKAGIDARYYPSLNDLKTSEPLDPAVIATAIQRGIMHDPGFLPVGPPTATGNVEKFPVSTLDTLNEAEQSGVERERLFVQTAIVGLPLALVQAAQAFFRGIITEADFKRAVSEGNTRNEWGDAALEVSRQILSGNQYAEAELRGYSTRAERLANTAKHGMTPEDSDLLHLLLGRPINIHQVTTGLARGGKFNPLPGQLTDPFEASVHEGNIKPAYYDLAIANRYSYPAFFALRAMFQAGIWTPAQAEQILLEIGWRPDFAQKVAAFYTKGGVAKGAGETQSELADEYTLGFIDETEYRNHLTALGLTGHEQDLEVLHAEAAAIKSARGAAVTKVRNLYEKGDIDEGMFRNGLSRLGMLPLSVDREVAYANVVRDPSA